MPTTNVYTLETISADSGSIRHAHLHLRVNASTEEIHLPYKNPPTFSSTFSTHISSYSPSQSFRHLGEDFLFLFTAGKLGEIVCLFPLIRHNACFW